FMNRVLQYAFAALSAEILCLQEVCKECTNEKISGRTRPYSGGRRTGKKLTDNNSEVLRDTQQKALFKSAKPLFIGSIPIAASKYPQYNNRQLAGGVPQA